jgi:hypothetical protein
MFVDAEVRADRSPSRRRGCMTAEGEANSALGETAEFVPQQQRQPGSIQPPRLLLDAEAVS